MRDGIRAALLLPLLLLGCKVATIVPIDSKTQANDTAAFDAVGNSIGFALALASIASIREILGEGKWFGLAVLPEAFPTWGVMILPPGAFLTLGLLLGLANWLQQALKKKAKAAA